MPIMKKITVIHLITSLVFLFASSSFAQKFTQLGQTPQMGWNSWNTFACDINEKLIRDMTDAIVASGIKDAGYEYVNIDDCWQGDRDSLGLIHADPKRFPSGIKALADYVHSKGLKLGIYSDAGYATCAGYAGSHLHEYQDAVTYASWGIDYVKYDWCKTKGIDAKEAYTTMRDAIFKAGRPMLFSMCEWGENKPWLWAQDVGHSWRTTGDIYPCFNCEGALSAQSILRILDQQVALREYAGPGHWNDMDMLEVGNGMSETEDRAHFSLWAMLASPLILGNDLRKMSEATRRILTHKEVIALNQDALGIQAFRFAHQGAVDIWVKPLSNNEWAILFLNRDNKPHDVNFAWPVINDAWSKRTFNANKQQYQWSNLWENQQGNTATSFNTNLPAHGVVVLKLGVQ
jgi:alpha-galactosidase